MWYTYYYYYFVNFCANLFMMTHFCQHAQHTPGMDIGQWMAVQFMVLIPLQLQHNLLAVDGKPVMNGQLPLNIEYSHSPNSVNAKFIYYVYSYHCWFKNGKMIRTKSFTILLGTCDSIKCFMRMNSIIWWLVFFFFGFG